MSTSSPNTIFTVQGSVSQTPIPATFKTQGQYVSYAHNETSGRMALVRMPSWPAIVTKHLEYVGEGRDHVTQGHIALGF